MSEHTPELWVRKKVANGDMDRWPMVVEDEGGRYVGSFFMAKESDAAKAAAAPEMLALLRELHGSICVSEVMPDPYTVARLEALFARFGGQPREEK